MSRLYRRKADASVAISSRRRLGIGAGDCPSFREPTKEQRIALQALQMGLPIDASIRWALIRDGFLKPGET